MYNYIKGEIIEITASTIIIEACGIGYEIYSSVDCLASVNAGETATIFTYLQIKEDSHTIYGFLHQSERALFLQLLNVSGVGAKSAIAMLSIGAETLRTAISQEDVLTISAIKGVSRKTAEKVILELRGKLPAAANSEVDDAMAGLVNLGLSRTEALSIIKSINTTGLTAEKIVSMALRAKNLSKNTDNAALNPRRS